MRAIIAIVVAKGLSLHQMDVKNAFWYGNLWKEIHMVQLEVIMMIHIPMLYASCAKPYMA